MKLEEFQIELQQLVRLSAQADGEETSLSSSFTETIFGLLVDGGEATDPRVSEVVFEQRKMQVSGIDWDDERSMLSLFVSAFDGGTDVATMTKAELAPLFQRLARFLEACPSGLFRALEESTDVYDSAQFIFETWAEVRSLRFVILTNSLLRTSVPSATEIQGRPVRYDVWDLERLERLVSSGRAQEPLDLQTTDFGLEGVDALGPYRGNEYESFLLVLPGSFLADVYEEFGPRLLELNVRSFLQVRGKTNQGIQATLRDEPDRFLAYNNGLSMTATSVELRTIPDGRQVITRIRGLQIVNGGQTTASLYYASRKAARDLEKVLVQAKLTVLQDDLRSTLAPLISKFANTQNLIKMADFTANDPFHVELEKASRGVWAPAVEGSREMTRWFYERSRGQFADALGRERTPAQKKQFLASHPRKQLFTKTDVAKFEHAWGQLPFSVALGAEKNFSEFSQRLAESKAGGLPDSIYFHHLVAKAIMWKQTEALVSSLKLGGYRSAVVAYTIALISNKTSMQVDLEAIWQTQSLPTSWAPSIIHLAPMVHASLVESAGSRNVLEWAKKKECWASLSQINWAPPAGLATSRTASNRAAVATSQIATSLPPSDEETAGRALISALGPDTWFAIATWAKQTGNLQAWQRGLSVSIGSYLSEERLLSAKQVVQGVKIAHEVERLGFRMSRPDIEPT